jgi:hypothetical protein
MMVSHASRSASSIKETASPIAAPSMITPIKPPAFAPDKSRCYHTNFTFRRPLFDGNTLNNVDEVCVHTPLFTAVFFPFQNQHWHFLYRLYFYTQNHASYRSMPHQASVL